MNALEHGGGALSLGDACPLAAVTCYIGIGSNMGDPPRQVEAACQAIAAITHTQLCACSALYHSKAVGFEGDDFVNAVVRITTTLSPHALLQALQGIEVQMGRPDAKAREGLPKTSRIIDLDLLRYGEMRLQSPLLTVPHPRMHERPFVTVPLAQVQIQNGNG